MIREFIGETKTPARTGLIRRVPNNRYLEAYLASELQNATWSCGNDFSEVLIRRRSLIVDIVIHRATYPGRRCWIKAILRMVEEIERFHAKLKSDSLGELERLVEAQIPIVDAGPAKHVPATVAELSSQRLRETRGVEPVVETLVSSVDVASGNLIGALCECAKQPEGIVGSNREWEPALEGCNA